MSEQKSLIVQYREYESAEITKQQEFIPNHIDQWLGGGGLNKEILPPTNMTKRDYWDEIEYRWPGTFYRFAGWIDDYKKTNDWKVLFNSVSDFQNALAPKFHDLPVAMQIGIVIEFATTQPHHGLLFPEEMPLTMNAIINSIKEWFAEEEMVALSDK